MFFSVARQRKLMIVSIVLVLSLFVIAKNVAAASNPIHNNERLVTIYDQGTEQTIITKAHTVSDALKQADIEVGGLDKVEPKGDTELIAQNYRVNIYRARPVILIDGSQRIKLVTSAQSPKQIFAAAGLTLYDEDKTSFSRTDDVVSDGGAGLKLAVDRATAFAFTLYGKQFEARTQAKTVGDMLKDKGVVLGAQDGASLALDTPLTPGMDVRVWRNGKQTVTLEEVIAKPTEQVKDMDREPSFKEVRTPGKDGKKQVTYEIETRDGKEVSRNVIASVTTLEPVKEVIAVGGKFGGSLGKWLLDLRTCETHGNYATNTGNGFYGAYQFMTSTWNSVASKSGRQDLVGIRPDLASPSDQDAMIIANTNMTAGLRTQNPGCYAKMGLSNYPPAQ